MPEHEPQQIAIMRRLVELPGGVGRTNAASNALSNWVGIALVAMGVVVAIATGLRFYFYAAEYRRQHQPPYCHDPILGPFFAAMVMVFGVALLVILLVAAG